MRRTEVNLSSDEEHRLIDYICELIEFASKPENAARLADDRKYQDVEHYVGSRVKQEFLRLNLIEPGEKGKLKTI